MANGDIAAAAGYPVVAATADARLGYDEINLTRDQLATHITTGGHAWAAITGKPSVYTQAQCDSGFVQNGGTGGAMRLDWNGSRVTVRIGVTDLGSLAWSTEAGSSAADAVTSAAYSRTVGSSNYAMWMGGDRLIGRNVSARKYKTDIEPHAIDPAAVLALEPVSYRLKAHPDNPIREFGLIADDVAEALPEIVTRYEGEIDGLRYDLLAVALLAVVKDQQARIEALEARIGGEG